MDANRQMDPLLEPHWQAYRGCLAMAAHVLRRSVERGRPMALPNVRRLFERRWHGVTRELGADDREAVFAVGRRRGRAWLSAYHPLNVPRQSIPAAWGDGESRGGQRA